MKQHRRILALLLCAAMVFSLFGCNQEPAATESPTIATEPPVTQPPADLSYADACALAEGLTDLVLAISTTKTTTVGGETFIEETDQTLSLVGWGTDSLRVRSEESVVYGSDGYYVDYTEVFADGTMYVTVDKSSYFSAPMTAEEISNRYLPAVLLDASLYGTIEWVKDSTIGFSDPTAAESWALPEGAEMVSASGTATVLNSGELGDTSYTITYTYGSAEVTLEATVAFAEQTTEIAAPGNPADFVQLQNVDGPRLSEQTIGLLFQSQALSTSALESVTSHAAGVVRNQSTTMDLYDSGTDFLTKVDIGIYLMDYSTNQSQELEQEEMYRDGKYTVTVDDGEPTEESGVTPEVMEEYCDTMALSHMIALDYWQDAAVTDLGSTYLMDLTFTEEFGDVIQDSICTMFWNDPDFLNNLASSHGINETSGYLAIDKYTGLPTAAGYYYEGTHTIQGGEYLLTLQSDQSITAPGTSAYYNITEEMLPEEEPENKATPLFYHVTGENGQQMWLMGTIHVGDERTGYLPQEIYDAFAASDALALEYNSKAFDDAMEEDDELQEEVSGAYYYSDGSSTADHVSEELHEKALQYIKASGNYTMNTPYMKASMWSSSIENFFLRQGYQLNGDQGMESRLEKLAEEQGKEILDVESGLFQIKMLTAWSEELQELLLEESLEYTAEEYWEDVSDLYEKWCAGDEAVLREELSDAVDTSEFTEEELAEYEAQKHLIEEYNKAMSYDRNDGMLQKAIEYLESGKTVFFAVGLAHLLNDVNGLVDALREAGYTVELVQYAQ